MAHLHFRVSTYKSGGAAASQRLEYITRTPALELSRAEQQIRYAQGEREDLVFANSRNLPAWTDGNTHVYFQAAEQYERSGGVAFLEMKISLPQELSHRDNMALTKDLVDAIAGDRLPCTYAFHDPQTMDSTQHQPHLHLLISTRKNDGHARTPAQHFRRYNAAHPEQGGAQKDPAFYHAGAVRAHRVLVSDILNAHLEQEGHTARVHPDTLARREIARQAEPKLLPSESRHYREHGIITETMQTILAIRAERAQQMPMEQENARTYWEERKHALGITHDMPMAERLERIRESRTHTISHAPERPTLAQLREQTQTLERSVNGLERYVQTVQRTLRQEQRREQQHGPWTWRQMRAAERVLADGVQHGLPRDGEAERLVAQLNRYLSQEQEPQAGAALNVRLSKEREQDRGMGW